jgi:hypothetical protein
MRILRIKGRVKETRGTSHGLSKGHGIALPAEGEEDADRRKVAAESPERPRGWGAREAGPAGARAYFEFWH